MPNGLHRRGGTIEHHVIPMPPDTPENKDDRRPQVPAHGTGAMKRGPPVHYLRARTRHPLQPVPPRQRPRPDLTGDHATKQEVLERLLLLVAEGAGRRPRQATPLEPICRPTSVTGHQRSKELAAVWRPRAPNLRSNRRHRSTTLLILFTKPLLLNPYSLNSVFVQLSSRILASFPLPNRTNGSAFKRTYMGSKLGLT
jgi:hypothetical protein